MAYDTTTIPYLTIHTQRKISRGLAQANENRQAAERGLQTWKSCGKSILASLPPKFLIAYWCRLTPQIDFCVNIVRKCRQNPLLTAWAAMEGEFHFDATPIAPPGSEMLMHEKLNRRRTWGFNAKKA